MPGIEITDAMIYNHAANPSFYQRGLTYFRQGRVFDFSYDGRTSTVYASVEGNESFYDVSISFSASDSIASSACECPAFASFDGGCKHIVAVLKEAQKNLRRVYTPHLPQPRSSNALHHIFEYFNSTQEEQKKDKVQIEVTLHVERESGHIVNSLEFRMGAGRFYIVRDIKELLLSYADNKPVEFGKNFTLDPAVHSFSKEDQNLIDMLNEIIENEDVRNLKYMYFNETTSVFKGKRVYLSDPNMRRFLTFIKSRSFNAVVFGSPYYSIEVVEANVPIDLVLKQENEEILLRYATPLRLIPLTKKSDFYFMEGVIYHPSPEQFKNFAPFYEAFASSAKNSISIAKGEMGRFVSEVLPFLQKAAHVRIDTSLEENFLRENLLTQIYFDRHEEGISARLEFHYGDEVVIPFTPFKPGATSDRILIRNPEEESRILDFFEKYEFKVEKEKIYLLDEKKIFEFIYSALPSLHELAEIYYSESFKRLKISNNLSFYSSIRLTDDSLLELSFNFEGVEPDELSAIFAALKEKKKYYRLKDGSFLSLNSPEQTVMPELLDKLGVGPEDFDNHVLLLPKYRALYLDSLIRESSLNHIERNMAFKQLVQNIKEPQDMDFAIPKELVNILRDYQKTGFKWLKTLASYGFGGILADDMGLGKTLQVIAFVLSGRPESSKPALVVAPTSLVYNWKDEVAKFVPSMKVSVISGVQRERVEQLKEIKDADIVVTSYALIRRDIDLYNDVEFSYCFLDEAQHIKNPGTINARSVKQIKAGGYFALTGTPIENSLTELWSIFDFIMPGYLLSHSQFIQKFEAPIIKNQEEEALKDLGRYIKPFILRRMKKDVLKELPEKIESKMTAEMTEDQKKIYLAYLNQAKNEIAAELEQNGFERSHIKILAILTRLRQICCHPSLFLENYEGESGKVSLLMELLLDALEGGHRILLFSQFTSMLQIIAEQLNKQQVEYFYLDGSTKAEARGDLVKAFNSGSRSVFLISLKAGGTGLNLTGADMVIHFDPWWNPAVEDQASDRAYRIGQNNAVQVIKLITQNTIEEKIFELQQKKRAMIDAVIQPGETLLTKMTEAEIRGLFEL